MTANFADFGTYLKSEKYLNELKALIGSPPMPPRDHWPVDKKELVQRHSEIGTMALDWAILNFRKANEAFEVTE